jgi:hypothetical protein
MAGIVHVPWYATALRGDKLAEALADVTALSLRYGATSYAVHRSDDDRYKLLQTVAFDSHEAWETFWYGEDMIRFRANTSGWYQVPVVYSWHSVVAAGSGPNGNGAGNGH